MPRHCIEYYDVIPWKWHENVIEITALSSRRQFTTYRGLLRVEIPRPPRRFLPERAPAVIGEVDLKLLRGCAGAEQAREFCSRELSNLFPLIHI